MQYYRILFSYDGSAFHGYQRQKDESLPTVQGILEEALFTLYQERIVLHASGRTDAGVHARGQVAHFATTRKLQGEGIVYALNRFLPPSIRIFQAETCAATFHARKSALGKHYSYRIYREGIPPAIGHQYFTFVPQRFVPEQLFAALADLTGAHSFAGFCGRGSSVKSYERHVFAIAMEEEGQWLTLHFLGDGFLRKMVRNMVGAALDIALGRKPAQSIRAALTEENRSLAGRTAPASGLCLEEVFYTRERMAEVLASLAAGEQVHLSAELDGFLPASRS